MIYWSIIVLMTLGSGFGSNAWAQDTGNTVLRYVSLSAGEANLRTGPGTRYPIDWVYKRRGLPVAIVDERDTWRKIRDMDGVEGWMHVSLLTRRRTAMITGTKRNLYESPGSGARIKIVAEPGVIGRLSKCKGLWCRLSISGSSGWIERRHLWGVGRDEIIE